MASIWSWNARCRFSTRIRTTVWWKLPLRRMWVWFMPSEIKTSLRFMPSPLALGWVISFSWSRILTSSWFCRSFSGSFSRYSILCGTHTPYSKSCSWRFSLIFSSRMFTIPRRQFTFWSLRCNWTKCHWFFIIRAMLIACWHTFWNFMQVGRLRHVQSVSTFTVVIRGSILWDHRLLFNYLGSDLLFSCSLDDIRSRCSSSCRYNMLYLWWSFNT